MFVLTFVFISFLLPRTQIEAQVISQELRRLAVSSNQFGIDALRALDRIEPPDKVLVFCPICISSSLAMIMMGSSKYQVVSPLRHALYVWSMKPAEINKGFKDIFNHIGLNQQMRHLDKEKQSRISTKDQQLVSDHGYVLNMRARLSLPELMKELDQQVPSTGTGVVNNSTKKSMTLRGGIESKYRDLSQMSAITNVYIQRGFVMNYQYNQMLRQFYQTQVHPVDFIRSGEETRQHINSLVSLSTEGKIRDILKKGFANSKSKIMIISAFHFRGTLDIRLAGMKEISTNPVAINTSRSINSKDNKSQRVYIETQKSLLKYGQFPNLACSVIEIPFNSRLVSLVIVMPNHVNSTDALLSKLNAKILSDMINSLAVRKLSVEIPVIKFDRGPVNVEGLMKELSLDSLFFANEPSIQENGLNKWMQPSDIVHETSIDIGTFNPKWDQVEDRLKVGAHEPLSDRRERANDGPTHKEDHIKLDKPFFYFVFDFINGLVLTMGRIRE